MILSAGFLAVMLTVSFNPPQPAEVEEPGDAGNNEILEEPKPGLDAALIYHARRGAGHHVVTLLKGGADPKAADKRGVTALQSAAAGGHVEIMQLLISRGADVNSKSNNGRTPLSAAAESHRAEAVALLLKAGATVHPAAFGQACWLNRGETVDLLLNAGAQPDWGIVWAAQGGHAALVRRLLEEGADINTGSDHGSTALHTAALQGGMEVVRLLLNEGADVTVQDNRGETPLHMAIKGDGDLDVIRLLVEAGAQIDMVDEEGVSPVRLAAQRMHRKAYEFLLAANGGVERRRGVGNTLLEVDSPKTTAELIDQLQSSDYATRKAAQRTLLSRRKDVVPQVLQAVEEGAPIEKFCPLFICIGAEAQAALPKLESLLDDKKRVFGAALTMERIKPGAFLDLPDESRTRAAAALGEAVNVPNPDVMEGIQLDFLASMGEVATPFILKLLRSDWAEVRDGTAGSIRFDVYHDAAIERELLNILRTDDAMRARISAARALGKGPQLSDEARAALLATVKLRPPNLPYEEGEDVSKRRSHQLKQVLSDTAARSLSNAGSDVIDDLIPLLSPMDAPARPAAIIALRSMGAPAIPRLVELLGHEDDAVAVSAVVALGRMGPPAAAELSDALRSDNQQVRHSAVNVLQQLRRGAKSAIPSLLEVIASPRNSDAFRVSAVRAALKIDAADVRHSPVIVSSIPLLIGMLDTGQFEHQGWAAEALGDIGPAAADALPMLRKRLELPGEDVDTGRLGPLFVKRTAEQAIPKIETVLPGYPTPK